MTVARNLARMDQQIAVVQLHIAVGIALLAVFMGAMVSYLWQHTDNTLSDETARWELEKLGWLERALRTDKVTTMVVSNSTGDVWLRGCRSSLYWCHLHGTPSVETYMRQFLVQHYWFTQQIFIPDLAPVAMRTLLRLIIGIAIWQEIFPSDKEMKRLGIDWRMVRVDDILQCRCAMPLDCITFNKIVGAVERGQFHVKL